MKTVPCAHCGEPSRPRDDEVSFCCTGCEAVYHAIRTSGLDHFYTLRGSSDGRPAVVDASVSSLDHPEFLERITHNEDGTCEGEVYLDGVHCAGCVWLVERMPRALDGVVEARLNLSRARLRLRWDPEATGLDAIAQWLTRFGYVPHPVDEERSGRHSFAERRMLIRVGIGWALAANIMLLAISLYAGLGEGVDENLAVAAKWASMIMCALSIGYGGREFLSRAWASIANWSGFGRLSVDVPISLGILVGFAHSSWATITGQGEIWFDSIAVLIAALLTARWLQMRGRRHASDAAERLLKVLPSRALRCTEDGVEEIEASALKPGDLIEVPMGDVIPADGIVVEGTSSLHRAILTGESRPEKVGIEDRVHAGETNLSNRLLIRVLAAGEKSRIGQLHAWIEDASNNRAPVVQLADRLSGAFVVFVLVSALATFVTWTVIADVTMATRFTVALLVISCPCALGMATPLALTVGMGRAARQGIFIKHDDVVEVLRDVEVVVFDKTGTLTQGRMSLVDVSEVDPEVLRGVAALEAKSRHPIARAFDPWFEESAVEPGSFSEHAGKGVEGVVEGRRVRVGRPDWLGADGDAVSRVTAHGHTPLAIEVAGRIVGVVGVGDALRPEAMEVVEQLRQRGVRPVLLSGDHVDVVDATARLLGIASEDAHGAQTPEMKLAFVTELKRESKTVAMVGDGVNDSAALQASDVGVAVHGGSDLNLVAADIFMTRPGILSILQLFTGADGIMRVVRRNLMGSATYNVVGISLAALGFVSPLFAAVAMPISSLAVVFSSLVQAPFEDTSAQDDESSFDWETAPGLEA